MTALKKTEQGHAALSGRDPRLAVVHRQVLVLCNGQRGLRDIAELIGPRAEAVVSELLALGLLQTVAPPASPAPASPHAATQPARSSSAAAPAAGGAAQRRDDPPPAPPQRRSLVMARMYLFDMMERALANDSAVARQHLRRADTPEALRDAVLDCVRLLQELAEPSFARRVIAQLLAMLPEDSAQLLARLRAVAEDAQPSML